MTAPYASTRYPGAALLMAAADCLALLPIVAAFLLGYERVALPLALAYYMLWCATGHVRWPGIAASRVLSWAMDLAMRIADRWQGRNSA